MIEEFEYKGIWWLPDKPDNKISGTLRFTPTEGAVLELMDTFKAIQDVNKMLEPIIILGFSSNGKEITLYKCFETKSNLSFPGFAISSFFVSFVFIGFNFQKPEDIQFKNISVCYSHLDEWVGISGIDIHPPEKDGFLIKYKFLEPIHSIINDNLKMIIVIQCARYSFSRVPREVSIKERTWIKIESTENKPFEYFQKIMYHTGNLLSLSITKPVYTLAMEGITGANNEVEVFFKQTDFPGEPKTLLPFGMLFSFRDISNRFEAFLRNWFSKADLLEPIYNLYFGTLYNPQMYLELQFLSLIQAVESYHQRKYESKYLSDEQYKPIYETIVGAIPDEAGTDLKKRLAKYLEYGNEYPLRKRLKELFDKYQEILSEYVKDNDAFINKVVDTRNYLTHYDDELKENAAKGDELYSLIQRLKQIVELCLLVELGFSSMEVKGLFSKNRRYPKVVSN